MGIYVVQPVDQALTTAVNGFLPELPTITFESAMASSYSLQKKGIRSETEIVTHRINAGEMIETQTGDHVLVVTPYISPSEGVVYVEEVQVDIGAGEQALATVFEPDMNPMNVVPITWEEMFPAEIIAAQPEFTPWVDPWAQGNVENYVPLDAGDVPADGGQFLVHETVAQAADVGRFVGSALGEIFVAVSGIFALGGGEEEVIFQEPSSNDQQAYWDAVYG